MKIWLFWLVIFFAVIAQGELSSFPIILDVLLISYILTRSTKIVTASFISGIFLDIFTVKTVGISSMFFVVFLFLVFLYERKFEITTLPFVLITSFLGSLGYLVLTQDTILFFESLVSAIITVGLFTVIFRIRKHE